MVQRLKRLPAMWETWVRSLDWEDPLEKELATHSSILAWRIPRTEKLGGLQSTGHEEWDTTERLHFHFHFHFQGILVTLEELLRELTEEMSVESPAKPWLDKVLHK